MQKILPQMNADAENPLICVHLRPSVANPSYSCPIRAIRGLLLFSAPCGKKPRIENSADTARAAVGLLLKYNVFP
jgi:hypothetical protein